MKQFAEKVLNANYELNEKGQMKQNVRNGLKADVLQAMFEMFQEAGLDAYRVNDGVAVNFENAELGSVAVVFDGVVKGLEYDAMDEAEFYENALKEKVEKALKAEQAKQARIAEKELLKAKVAEKKAKAVK